MIELNKIYNEDCLEGMKRIPDGSVDCIVCDLPYGVLNKQSEGGGWDSIIPLDSLWEQYLRISKSNAAIILFGQGMFTAKLMMSNEKMWRYNITWDKCRTTGFFEHKEDASKAIGDYFCFLRRTAHLSSTNAQMSST